MITPPLGPTLFPYTTLFRSLCHVQQKCTRGVGHIDGSLARQPETNIVLRQHHEPDAFPVRWLQDRKSTRLNSSHRCTSYAGLCLKKNTSHFETATGCNCTGA